MEWEQLIGRLKKDDISAFNEIYNQYFEKLLRFAYSFSISSEDAEEIVQSLFVKLWDKRKLIDPKKSIDSFLYVMARNLIIDRIRKQNIAKHHLEHYFNDQHIALRSNLEEKMDSKELADLIDEIVQELPPKRRMVFELNRYQGMTYKDIAKQLDISDGTVEKHMSKALKALREKLSYLGIL